VIAVSHGLKRELVEYYGVDDARISVIPNGVDHAVFRPCPTPLAKRRLRTALGLPETSFIALFVGGDWHRKGVADAIEAVGGMADTSLVILGRGREDLFREVAERAGAAAQVFFVQPSATPQDYYAAADAFVFPSRYEAFSLATLEASAAGLPILALRINGTEELIRDGVNGFFVEPSPDSIRQRLVTLRDDTAVRLSMSDASLEASLAYGWGRIATQHLGLLAAVAAERN
jgi:UDP-glucose:(heptosyl)LPS alpha-1,3-glucosyltransferase